MNDESKDKLALAAVIAGYGSIAALIVRRFLRETPAQSWGKSATSSGSEQAVAGGSELLLRAPLRDENLQSLSAAVPGCAPLDELAARAAAEERGEARRARAGGSVETEMPLSAGAPQPWAPGDEAVRDLLSHQLREGRLLRDWNKPVGDRLPVPTFAPAVMAFGIVVFAMGLATVWYVCVAGSLVFAVAAWRWAGELQGE
jgi:hypothetical protein